MADKTEALVKRSSDITQGFTPANLAEAKALAEDLAKSELLPPAFRGKPYDVYWVLLTAHELDIPPTQALRRMHVINGKVGMDAALKIALVKRRTDVCKYIRCTKSDEKYARWETLRAGDAEPQYAEYTIEKARAAGLLEKAGPWRAYPDIMLRWRAGSHLVDFVYPDIIGGIYSNEEVEEMADQPFLERIPVPGGDATIGPVPSAPKTNTKGETDAEVVQSEAKPSPPPAAGDSWSSSPDTARECREAILAGKSKHALLPWAQKCGEQPEPWKGMLRELYGKQLELIAKGEVK